MSKLPQPRGLQVPRRGIPTAGAAKYPRSTALPGTRVSFNIAGHQSVGSSFPRKAQVPEERCPQQFSKYGIGKSLRTNSSKMKENTSKTQNATESAAQEKIARKIDRSFVHSAPQSVLRKQVALQTKCIASKAPLGSKVTAIAAKKSTLAPMECIPTPAGPQKVLQRVTTEKRVERTKHGEIVSRNIKTVQTDECTGETTQLDEEVQIVNPAFPAREGLVKEIMTIVTERDITAAYESRKENMIQEVVELEPATGLKRVKIWKLVDEENEDFRNISRLSPPILMNQSPELHSLKKRLQALKASPEQIASLERSLINPPTSPDEVTVETTPELIATIMHAADTGGFPICPPERVYNSLFKAECKNKPCMIVSSTTPGPLNDVMVPLSISEEIHEGMLSERMEEASMLVQIEANSPRQDDFATIRPTRPKRRKRKIRKYEPLRDEDPPWCVEDLHVAIDTVGAQPQKTLHSVNVIESIKRGTIRQEMVKGIEYMLDADTLQYYSRVQLRGSRPPPWFPGYMMALNDTIEIAQSPSEILFSAWKSVQPNVFSDDSILYN